MSFTLIQEIDGDEISNNRFYKIEKKGQKIVHARRALILLYLIFVLQEAPSPFPSFEITSSVQKDSKNENVREIANVQSSFEPL